MTDEVKVKVENFYNDDEYSAPMPGMRLWYKTLFQFEVMMVIESTSKKDLSCLT